MQRLVLRFVHGFMGHSSDWDPVRAALPEFDSTAIDLALAPDWETSVAQIAESMSDHTVLIGYSMGARLALGVALEAPERCAGLVFLSGNPGIEDAEERTKRLEFDHRVADQIETEPVEDFLKRWYEMPVFEAVDAQIRTQEIERKQRQSSDHWPALMRANTVAGQPNYWPRLNQLPMPVLAVAGQLDDKYRKIAQRFAQAESPSGVTAEVVPNCGHMVHREQPAAFANIVRDFVNRIDSN